MLKTIYRDSEIIVCVKPDGVSSADDAGGMPSLIREESGTEAVSVHTVHRLDRAVGGLMVYALTDSAAAKLSRDISERRFDKEYLAVLHGCPENKAGRLDDLLFHDSSKNRTFVVNRMRKGVREASLEYEVLCEREGVTLVKVRLLTGRTHQIRAQFSSRKMPLVGDGKYGGRDNCGIALWSCSLGFEHPADRRKVSFSLLPPAIYPWNLFPDYCE